MRTLELVVVKPVNESELTRNIAAVATAANKLGLEGKELVEVGIGTLVENPLHSVIRIKYRTHPKRNGRIIA